MTSHPENANLQYETKTTNLLKHIDCDKNVFSTPKNISNNRYINEKPNIIHSKNINIVNNINRIEPTIYRSILKNIDNLQDNRNLKPSEKNYTSKTKDFHNKSLNKKFPNQNSEKNPKKIKKYIYNGVKELYKGDIVPKEKEIKEYYKTRNLNKKEAFKYIKEIQDLDPIDNNESYFDLNNSNLKESISKNSNIYFSESHSNYISTDRKDTNILHYYKIGNLNRNTYLKEYLNSGTKKNMKYMNKNRDNLNPYSEIKMNGNDITDSGNKNSTNYLFSSNRKNNFQKSDLKKIEEINYENIYYENDDNDSKGNLFNNINNSPKKKRFATLNNNNNEFDTDKDRNELNTKNNQKDIYKELNEMKKMNITLKKKIFLQNKAMKKKDDLIKKLKQYPIIIKKYHRQNNDLMLQVEKLKKELLKYKKLEIDNDKRGIEIKRLNEKVKNYQEENSKLRLKIYKEKNKELSTSNYIGNSYFMNSSYLYSNRRDYNDDRRDNRSVSLTRSWNRYSFDFPFTKKYEEDKEKNISDTPNINMKTIKEL